MQHPVQTPLAMHIRMLAEELTCIDNSISFISLNKKKVILSDKQ